ncbi:condensation domain-containing protein [Streptomyces sp. NPDC050161]|uniref:condensation domain-containing protein n=1 Tax=Streptomyces sp. NPDC050161 TaxID=3365604 RepID=UPI0037BD02D9
MQPSRVAEIRFSGCRRDTRRLTWAQRLLWNDTQWLKPEDHFYNQALQFKIPERHSTRDVLAALGALVQRHEALRTRFTVSDGGEPMQEVTAEGALSVDILSTGPAEVDAVAREWLDIHHDISFTFPEEWPTRVAVVEVDGSPNRVLFVISHITIDGVGERILEDEFHRIVAEGAESALLRSAAYQPLDRAAYEATREGIRQSESTLGYWEAALRATPARMFSYPQREPARPRYVNVSMNSEAISESLNILAGRYRVTNPAVLAAATAAVLSSVTGNSNVLLKTVSNNRFVEDFSDMVGIALGNSLMAVPVGHRGFTEVIRDVGKTAIDTIMNAQCDPVELYERVARRNHERGVYTDLFEAFINDRRYLKRPGAGTELSGAELRKLAEKSTVYVNGSWERKNATFFLDAGPNVPGGDDIFHIMADTAFLSTAEIKQLLRGLETLLVTAVDREVPCAELPDLIGLPRPERGDGWKLIDRCWVDMAQASDVLRQVSGSTDAALFAVDSGAGEELVAYVRSDDPRATPESIHRSFVAALEDHPSVVAPGRYVICRSAPELPAADEAAWMRQPVVHAGTGRTGR